MNIQEYNNDIIKYVFNNKNKPKTIEPTKKSEEEYSNTLDQTQLTQIKNVLQK